MKGFNSDNFDGIKEETFAHKIPSGVRQSLLGIVCNVQNISLRGISLILMANFKCQKMQVFEGVKRKLLRPKFNMESGNHFYMEFASLQIFYE
jgi:hypothetical protein